MGRIDLGKECEHDLMYAEVAQAATLVQYLQQASASVEYYFVEMDSLTEFGKTNMKHRMQP